MYDGSVTITEWNITLSPFSATYNRGITIPPQGMSAGLGAINDTTLLNVVGNGLVPPSYIPSLYTIDITTSTAILTYKFDLISNRYISGDLYLTTNNKVIATTQTIFGLTYITQYDYITGAMEMDLELTPTIQYPWGIFQQNDEIFITSGPDGLVYHINKTSPYNLTLTGSTNTENRGASQVPSCLTTSFVINAVTQTPTPTKSVTPSTTNSSTPTPTKTSTPSRTKS
jgi:hypothetical protein